MFAKHLSQGKLHRGLLAAQGHKDRCFTQPAAQPHADDPEHAPQQERITPGVAEYFLGREHVGQQGCRQGAQQIAEREPSLQKTQGIAASPGRCMFGNEGPGTGHFTADCSPLQNAQSQQQQRRRVADVGIRRHDADEQARQRHHQNAQAEHALAAQVISEMRHQDATQWSGQVTGDEDAETLQQP